MRAQRNLRFAAATFLALTALASADGKPVAVPKGAVVAGRLAAVEDCQKTSDQRRPQVWLSAGQILLYQAEVPVDGTYEFHVVPGKYELSATNSKGCLAQARVDVAEGKVAETDLKLAPAREPAAEGSR